MLVDHTHHANGSYLFHRVHRRVVDVVVWTRVCQRPDSRLQTQSQLSRSATGLRRSTESSCIAPGLPPSTTTTITTVVVVVVVVVNTVSAISFCYRSETINRKFVYSSRSASVNYNNNNYYGSSSSNSISSSSRHRGEFLWILHLWK